MMLLNHLMKTAIQSFFRVALTILVFGVIGAGLSLLIAYQTTHEWPPRALTDVIVAAIGVLLGYAAGLTVLLREAIRGVLTVEHDVAGGIEHLVQAPMHNS
jgi:hypothetical protein